MLHNKFWQGFFAIAPLVSLLITIVGYFIFFFTMISNIKIIEATNEPPAVFFAGIGFFFLMIFFAIFMSIGSLIFFIIHAVKNPDLKENNLLIVWIILFVFVSGIGQLIYWIVEIVGKRKQLNS